MAYHRTTSQRQKGFSLIEMMVVVFVLTVIMGSVFKAISLTQQTSASQQVRLDLTQESREFVDQLTRDLRTAGYPYQRNMASAILDPNAAYNLVDPDDPHNAPGLIYVNNNALWFAGNVDGTGDPADPGTALVKIIRYDYVAAGAGQPGCPCLRRTEFQRNGGDPYTDASTPGGAVAQLEIQGVQNGTAANPIFTVYDDTGAALVPPLKFDDVVTAQQLAGVNSLKIVLTVQSTLADATGNRPVTTVVSTVALANCSEALGNGQTPAYCN